MLMLEYLGPDHSREVMLSSFTLSISDGAEGGARTE